MDIQTQLIQLFTWVCSVYDTHLQGQFQRWSNNPKEPDFSDQELMTIYIFGHLQGHRQCSAIHAYMLQHWLGWFPKLPSYEACNRRLNTFHEIWPTAVQSLCPLLPDVTLTPSDQVLDSVPIMLAVRGRSCHAKVARDQAEQGYCATKKMYYYGLKLHLLGQKRYQQMPVPLGLCLTPAARHDLPVLQDQFATPLPGALFGDKAYCDQATANALAAQGTTLCTPDKQARGQTTYGVGESGLWSRFVSTMRQPVESFFNWLIEKTGLQSAAKVRSSAGLTVHCYGKLTVAFYLLCFYP